MLTKDVTIINKLGLHARAAAKFVATSSKFSSQIDVSNGDKTVSAKSIMGVMLLAASQGTVLHLSIQGKDEVLALETLIQLIENRFGEVE